MVQSRIHVGRYVTVIFIVIWSLFPVYWALNTSLMSNAAAQSSPAQFLPFPIDWANYAQILNFHGGMGASFAVALWNTCVECVLASALTVFISVFSSYAFARMDFPLKNFIFYTILFTLSLPAYATLIPLYRIMTQVALVNTYTGIVLVYVSGFLPLSIWILYNYFHTIPKELEESAFIDGASTFSMLLRIMLPLSLPGIASTAIVTFLTAWGQFLFPLVLTSDSTTQPLTVFMTGLQTRHSIPFTLMNAVGVLSVVVPAVFVAFFNRYIIRGMVAGSGK